MLSLVPWCNIFDASSLKQWWNFNPKHRYHVLVGGLVAINFIFPLILGISSSQLTDSYFSGRGGPGPPTSVACSWDPQEPRDVRQKFSTKDDSWLIRLFNMLQSAVDITHDGSMYGIYIYIYMLTRLGQKMIVNGKPYMAC